MGLFSCLGFNIIYSSFLKRLNNSPWGRALRAVREDEDAVRAMGKNAVWLKLQSFMLGAGIAGLSGVLLAFNYGSLETTVFVPLLTFYVWAIMILGGVGTITGPIFGSIIFGSLFLKLID